LALEFGLDRAARPWSLAFLPRPPTVAAVGQQTTVIKFTDKDSGELLQTMSESNYRRNACLTWSAREMPIEQIIDAFNETSLTVRGEVCR